MTTDRDESGLIRSWLDETYEAEHDAQPFLDRVLDDVPNTPQRRRRWRLLPTLRRSSAPLTADPTTDYQPTPTPALNGHTPTVTGRTQSMFSPAKAITASALVFAIGGVMLIAQPFDQRGGGVPGAATVVEAMRPALVTGTLVHHNPSWETGRVEASDPRLTGDVTLDGTLELIPNPIVPDVEGLDAEEFARFGAELFWGSLRIENDAGAWVGQFTCAPTVATHGFEDPCIIELTGAAAYEGLSAVLVESSRLDQDDSGDTYTLDGLIFAGNLPPDR